MPQESIHLADLYKHDEIYWVPADRILSDFVVASTSLSEQPAEVSEATASSNTGIDPVSEVELTQPGSRLGDTTKDGPVLVEPTIVGPAPAENSASGSAHAEPIPSVSVQRPALEVSKPIGQAADSFEHEPTLDAEALPKPVIPTTTWLVIGDLSGAERGRLQLIFSAPPMLLSEQDWAIYTPRANEPSLSAFIAQAPNKKFVFLGQQPAVWQSDFQVTEIVQQADKLIYFFPRLLSTLTDAEKSLKLVFWNAIKDMK